MRILTADGAAMTVTARSLVFAKAYAMSSSIAHKAEPSQKPEIIRMIRSASSAPTAIALYLATPTTRVTHSASS